MYLEPLGTLRTNVRLSQPQARTLKSCLGAAGISFVLAGHDQLRRWDR